MSIETPEDRHPVKGEKVFSAWNNPYTREEWGSKHAVFAQEVREAVTFGQLARALEAYASGNEWVLALGHLDRETYIDPYPILEALRTNPASLQSEPRYMRYDDELAVAYDEIVQGKRAQAQETAPRS